MSKQKKPWLPHISKEGQWWVCSGRGVAGVGVTPVAAYNEWYFHPYFKFYPERQNA